MESVGPPSPQGSPFSLEVTGHWLKRTKAAEVASRIWMAVRVTDGLPDTTAARQHLIVPGLEYTRAFRGVGGKG